jgi:hypothetical protein
MGWVTDLNIGTENCLFLVCQYGENAMGLHPPSVEKKCCWNMKHVVARYEFYVQVHGVGSCTNFSETA